MTEIFFQEAEPVAKVVRVSDAVLAERNKLISEGKCIGCKCKHSDKTVVRRGLCDACYRAYLRYKGKRKVTQSDLIREGKLLPISKGGRKPSSSFTADLSQR